jgi:hypothetical protein
LAAHGLLTSSDQPTDDDIVALIRKCEWWQGSVIDGAQLKLSDTSYADVGHWVVASQTCNLYNPSLKDVPSIELVAAHRIGECKPLLMRGDNPRILHGKATSSSASLCLEIDILRRRWIPRRELAALTAPTFALRDSESPGEAGDKALDTFISWMARSYTRVTLPDEFNNALRASKLEDVLKEKLAKRNKDELHGIYLSIKSDKEEGDQWQGPLGLMPPPYNLGVTIVTQGNADPEKLKNAFLQQVFDDKINDPGKSGEKITRAELAMRHQIRLIKQGVEAMPMDVITLGAIQELVRYSFVDYLSDSAVGRV